MGSEWSRRHPIGYGDLLDALRPTSNEADAEQIAAFLGFEAQKPHARPRTTEIDEHSPLELPDSEPPPFDASSSVLFWRPTQVEFQFEPDATPEPEVIDEDDILRPDDIGRDPNAPRPPARAPIVAWSRLRRQMEEVYRLPRALGEVHVDAIVDRIGRGLPVTRIPRRDRRVGVRRLVVILDRAERLIPFWQDQIEIYVRLRLEFGDAVRPVVWETGPPIWIADHEAVEAVSSDLWAGDAVLVLSDLGHHHRDEQGRHDDRVWRTWSALGRALRNQGLYTAALLPCPASRWQHDIRQTWHPIDWENPHGGARMESVHTEVDRLLALLSWTVVAEPELIREVRMLMERADLGTEADLWNHPGVERHQSGLSLPAPLRQESLERLHAMIEDGDRALLISVVDIVRRRHAWRPREIWIEEARNLELLRPGDGLITPKEYERVRQFTRRTRNTLGSKKYPNWNRAVDLNGWLSRSICAEDSRIGQRAWRHPELGRDLARTVELSLENQPEPKLPPGLDVGEFSASGPNRGTLRQVGKELGIGGDVSRGSPVIEVVAHSEWISFDADVRRISEGGVRWQLPADADEVIVRTTGQVVVLRREPRPSWASAAGRDEFGLWAAFRVGEVEQRMRWIPPGRFMMGSPEEEKGRWRQEGSRHSVTLTEGYWIADTPCTQKLWVAVMGKNPSRFKRESRPVECASWNEVQNFIARLDQQTEPGFGLPTEAQWEYACRAGTDGPRYGELDEIAWYGRNSNGESHDVGLKRPNSWGLHDMLGNVWEWCATTDFEYGEAAAVDPAPGSGRCRVFRGGSWLYDARYVRAACRSWYEPDARFGALGFRLIRGRGLRQAGQASEIGKQERSPGDPAKRK